MHHKFVTVSDTRWRPGVDPVVVSSSANWSNSPLRQWQSTVTSYDDRALAREFGIQFETMLSCASPGHCASWSSRLRALGLDAASYAMTAVDRLWFDDRPTVRMGSPGRGSSVFFSPRRHHDWLVNSLDGYTCTAQHRTIRVGHMFVTPSRVRVLEALARLRSRGCRVSMVLSTPVSEATRQGVRLARQLGFSPTCLRGMHDKLITVDAVVASTGRPDRSLWEGSQSLGGHALRSNDEAMLRLSTEARRPGGRSARTPPHRRLPETDRHHDGTQREELPGPLSRSGGRVTALARRGFVAARARVGHWCDHV